MRWAKRARRANFFGVSFPWGFAHSSRCDRPTLQSPIAALCLGRDCIPAVAGFHPQSAVGPELSLVRKRCGVWIRATAKAERIGPWDGICRSLAVIIRLRLSASSSRRACWSKCCSMSSC